MFKSLDQTSTGIKPVLNYSLTTKEPPSVIKTVYPNINLMENTLEYLLGLREIYKSLHEVSFTKS